ncbi:MAG: hypothetical protein INQ03_19650 [Candidatus Heimdallarchaeota archaeon]|nr:hypothetical protein [Candidatus Heimdallarchaeota archaeon]
MNNKIDLKIIDIEPTTNKPKPEDKFSFQSQYVKKKTLDAIDKTDKLNCSFCGEVFKYDFAAIEDFKSDQLQVHCPSCGSLLKVYRKK